MRVQHIGDIPAPVEGFGVWAAGETRDIDDALAKRLTTNPLFVAVERKVATARAKRKPAKAPAAKAKLAAKPVAADTDVSSTTDVPTAS